MDHEASMHQALANPLRRRLVALRRTRDPAVGVREPAGEFGVHHDTLRACLGVLERGYRFLAPMSAGRLQATAEAPAAVVTTIGAAWGRHPVDRHSPYEQLGSDGGIAQEHREVVCAVHLGLVRGAPDELGVAVKTAAAMHPFVAPDRCVTDLAVPA
jgi:hypothetical protein